MRRELIFDEVLVEVFPFLKRSRAKILRSARQTFPLHRSRNFQSPSEIFVLDLPTAAKMGRPKRNLLATVEDTLTPPDALSENQSIARITKAAGNNLYNADLPSGESILVELEAKFRSTIWIKRGSYVVVDTQALADRDNKLDGEIVNIVRDERQWRKMSYWYEYCYTLIAREIYSGADTYIGLSSSRRSRYCLRIAMMRNRRSGNCLLLTQMRSESDATPYAHGLSRRFHSLGHSQTRSLFPTKY